MSEAFDPLTMPLGGVHSISASAGTGKTWTITTLYLRYLLESQCHADSILVTTFTDAATVELKDRIRGRLKEALTALRNCPTQAEAVAACDADELAPAMFDLLRSACVWESADGRSGRALERVEAALLSFDQAPIFTIHGFCNRVLQEQVFETGNRFNLELQASLDDLIQEAAHDFAARQWLIDDAPIQRWLPLDAGLMSTLLQVARAAVDHPGFEIVPDGSDLDGLLNNSLMQRFDVLLDELAQAWDADGAGAVRLLLTAREQGLLHAGRLGKKPSGPDARGSIESAVESLESLLAARSLDTFETKNGEVQAKLKQLTQSNIVANTKKAEQGKAPQHAVFQILEQLIELVPPMERHRTDIRVQLLGRLAMSARLQVERRKAERGVMSYGDMLHRVDEALQGPQQELLLASLRERYHVALVDEFQDTDPVQYRIFSRIFRDGSQSNGAGLPNDTESPDSVWSYYETESEDAASTTRAFVMIGDPKQSIYRFRGADLQSYLDATGGEVQCHEMGTNWRSDTSLVEAVQAVFRSVRDPFLNVAIPLPQVDAAHGDRIADEPALSITLVPRSNDVPTDKPPAAGVAEKRVIDCLVDDIVRRLHTPWTRVKHSDAGDVRTTLRPKPSDIAVLARTGRQLHAIQAALADHGVPSVLQTDQSVLTTSEAQAVLLVLRAVLKPGQRRHLAPALSTVVFGWKAAALAELQSDSDLLSRTIERFHDWHQVWLRDGFMAMWRRLLDGQETLPRLARLINGERQITNLLHLGELIHRRAAESHSGPEELVRWYEATLAGPDATDAEAQIRLETDASAVQLCTIHKSKGLEYPIVYCPMLWRYREYRTPSILQSRQGDRLPSRDGEPVRFELLDMPQLDVGSNRMDDRIARDQADDEAEDRRLLYVALTRARHQCHIHWPAAKDMDRTALGRLIFAPPEQWPAWNESRSGSESTGHPAAAAFRPAIGVQTDDDLEAALRHWTDRIRPTGLPAAIALRALSDVRHRSAPGRYVAESAASPTLSCPEIQRRALREIERISFTSLSRSVPEWFDDASDRDDLPASVLESALESRLQAGVITDWSAQPTEIPSDGESSAQPPESGTSTSQGGIPSSVPLADMPGGRRVGDLVHRVLEEVLTDRHVPGRSRDELQNLLSRRLEPELSRVPLDAQWLTPLAAVMATMLTADLSAGEDLSDDRSPDTPLRLADLPSEAFTCELPFLLNCGHDEAGPNLSALADAFEAGGRDAYRRYAQRIRQMQSLQTRGLLAGFIDLVFQHAGRWYIADYKTTTAGHDFQNYSHESLEHAMESHDYLLQAAFYCVALREFLRQRLPDFDEARDFGGVCYLFVRGFADSETLIDAGNEARPATDDESRIEPGTGIWFDRPTSEFLDAVADALGIGVGVDV